MDFPQTEIVFYAVAFITAAIACLARIWRDNERIELYVIFGRCMSSAILGCGTVSIWLGDSAGSDGNGGFYWLAVAALVGYCSRDIQDQVLTRVINWLIGKFGPKDGS